MARLTTEINAEQQRGFSLIIDTSAELKKMMFCEMSKVWSEYKHNYVPDKYDQVTCSLSVSTQHGWLDLFWRVRPKEFISQSAPLATSSFEWSYLKVSTRKGYRSRSNKDDVFWSLIDYYFDNGTYPK